MIMTGACPDLFFDYDWNLSWFFCSDYDGLFFLLVGFDDWRDVEDKCENDGEDEWFDNVVVDCVMEFGMGEDAAN